MGLQDFLLDLETLQLHFDGFGPAPVFLLFLFFLHLDRNLVDLCEGANLDSDFLLVALDVESRVAMFFL